MTTGKGFGAAVEEKFVATAFRISQERNDFLLPQILDFVKKKKWLNLRPEYQRRLVWDVKKRSLFIESLLLNIPIPPLFLYERELGRYEVMDGQQRLNAVLGFYDNSFALKGLEKWEELNGLHYKDLPETLSRGLDRRRLSATVLLVGSTTPQTPQNSDIRKLVFERLNTGGQHLNAQELRNCLYEGPFNDLLVTLARSRLFTKIWDIPATKPAGDDDNEGNEEPTSDRLYRRMIDCEIVLRYFAFSKRSRIKGSVRTILDRTMEENATLSDVEASRYGKKFIKRLKLAYDIFGAHTFRYEDSKQQWRLSQPLYDAVMVSLNRLWDSRQVLRQNKVSIANAVRKLLKNKAAYGVVVGRPNTAKAIMRRVDLLTKTIGQAAHV